jgi:sulfate adenylyltransferase (ADP) / ATP adenylyltransferase
LPYDAALFVADVGAEHVCLLNKFNVVDHHLLIVSRDFVHQDRPLEVADFAVWWRCLNEYDSLGFYNGGARAGASQPHRHLQLVPLPLADSGPRIPLESLLDAEHGRSTGCQPVARTGFEPEFPGFLSITVPPRVRSPEPAALADSAGTRARSCTGSTASCST